MLNTSSGTRFGRAPVNASWMSWRLHHFLWFFLTINIPDKRKTGTGSINWFIFPSDDSIVSYFSLWIWLAGVIYCPDLWVLVYLLGVLLITVDVEPDGCSGAARTAETENNSGTIREDDPQALREKEMKKRNSNFKTRAGRTWFFILAFSLNLVLL